MAVFGSILRGNFPLEWQDPIDVDLRFGDDENVRKNWLLQVRMKFKLEEFLLQKEDFSEQKAILTDSNSNHIRLQHILESSKIFYLEG